MAVATRQPEHDRDVERLTLVPAPHAPPRKPRFRRFHAAAVAAAFLYLGAMLVAWEIVQSAWYSDRQPVPEAAAAPGALALDRADRAALRTLAARAQRSVYPIETTSGPAGSGFVGWVMQGESYVITAHLALAGVLSAGGTTVFVRDGDELRTGRVIRQDAAGGLALIRLPGELGRPLWQRRAEAAELEAGSPAFVIAAGSETAVGEGLAVEAQDGRFTVRAQPGARSLGAPVIGEDGRIAGVVVQAGPGALAYAVPIEAACDTGIRRCS